MRLVTFVPKRGAAPRVGIVREGYQVVDLTAAGSKPPFDPEDMVSLIAAGARGRAARPDARRVGQERIRPGRSGGPPSI